MSVEWVRIRECCMEKNLGISSNIINYVREHSLREPDVLARLRDETAAIPQAMMQITPEQGQFMAWLVHALGVKRAIELGTFTGYSSTVVALAMPEDGHLIYCDVSEQWTSIARRYWAEAGVAHKIELRIGPGIETLRGLIADDQAGTFDFAFIYADKDGYPDYFELCLQLVRTGGVLAFDNMLRGGTVADPEKQSDGVLAMRAMNDTLHRDERVSISLLPFADGITLALKR